MKRKHTYYVLGIIFILSLIFIGYYFGGLASISNKISNLSENHLNSNPPSSSSHDVVSYQLEVVAENLFVPWGIVFTSSNRFLVSERNGNLRVVINDTLQSQPLAHFNVSTKSEEGLMGLALDPDYKNNHYIYACLAYENNGLLYDKVIRFVDANTSISQEITLLDKIPAAQYHAGCRLLFLPDKTLLITTGDATQKNIAQDLNSLGGKILRINRDGSIPSNNPEPTSPIWSYGHRNSQGLALDIKNNILWSTEHGPSINDGPAGGDEVNLIEKGNNYGWPIIHHRQTKPGLISPELEFTPAIAPAGLLYYTSNLFPQFTDKLLMATLKGEALYVLEINRANPKKITNFEKISDITVGRLREVIQAPDGSIYIATSNQDGRGDSHPGDDKIYRLVPKK